MGPCRSRLNRPGGMAWQCYVGHSESASMFSPYMMLHVLFFLDLLWDVKKTDVPPKWCSVCGLLTLYIDVANISILLMLLYQTI